MLMKLKLNALINYTCIANQQLFSLIRKKKKKRIYDNLLSWQYTGELFITEQTFYNENFRSKFR